MALLVGGVAASHSPQLAIPAEGWTRHGDLEEPRLRELDLEPTTRHSDELQEELDPSMIAARYEACQRALEETGDALRAMRPDVLVVVGDDQKELFLEDIMPAVSIFWGAELFDRPPGMEVYPPSMEAAYPYYHSEEEESYQTDAGLGLHLVKELVASDFDIAQSSVQPEGRSLGHAFTFIYRRLLDGSPRLPLVPIFLNTYYPPNQPTPRRCIALGRALADAISSMPGDLRVALVASGGLSHPIIDEKLDHRVMTGLEHHQWDDLASIPMDVFKEGTSELLNWILVGAALEKHPARTVDYIPAYRSIAGSGCGMGFMTWSLP
jgi:aromatic ring-opening dioxygenase catalytic subunit (LigB family)